MKTREIKFRNWYKVREGRFYADTTPPKMIYLSFQQTIDEGRTLLFTDEERSWIDESDFEEPILMQFTGLKDKNGKEIYEGDIIIRDGNYYVIEFIQARFKAVYKGGEDKSLILGSLMWDESEVAGNVFENPNLLV